MKWFACLMFAMGALLQYLSYHYCDGKCTDYISVVVPLQYGFSSIGEITCYDPGYAPGMTCGATDLLYASYACLLAGFIALIVMMNMNVNKIPTDKS